MPHEPSADAAPVAVGRGGRRALLVAVAVTIALYVFPGGGLVGRPLVWVSTLFHEFGHGAVTAVVGGDVEAIRVYGDGSGLAEGRRPAGRLRSAAVAAGGLVGPAAFAALLFAAGRRRRFASPVAVGLGVALWLTVPFAVRGPIALGLAVLLGGAFLLVGLRARPAVAQVALLFLAVQLALSVFSRRDYLFVRTAFGGVPSDSAQIATALIGPYWFWGAVCGLLSVVVLAAGLRGVWHQPPQD